MPLKAATAWSAIRAVTVDLDDTLYPQSDYLAGAWRAVADAAAEHDVARLAAVRLHRALVSVAAEGSDRGRIIDRALELAGLPGGLAGPLVERFRDYAPAALEPYPGVRVALARLRRCVPVACVTDGDPGVQRAKLAALGLVGAFDALVISDEVCGREHRKPDPAPFLAACERLGVEPAQVVHVGDRPGKDVAGAAGVGMLAVRVRTGEYAGQPDSVGPISPTAVFDDAVGALQWIGARLGRDFLAEAVAD